MKQRPMLYEDMEEILRLVRYRNWQVRVEMDGDGFYLQWFWYASEPEDDSRRWDDVLLGIPVPQVMKKQTSRKWRLSEYMTKSELVQTALKAVLTAEEHEARESFRYRGKAIFGPHFDVDTLFAIADEKDLRA